MLPTVEPMLATYSEPFDSPNFTYEIKWDGYRCLAYLDAGTKLLSRHLKDLGFTFPELLETHKKFKTSGAILDGEVIAIRNGKPNFFELQKRGHMRNSKAVAAAAKQIPVVYVIFDLLFFNHQPLYKEPIEKRRELLKENLIYSDELILTDSIAEKGKDYFEGVSSLGLEGVVAKKKGSLYYPGKRSKLWYKFKQRKRSNFIVCGIKYENSKPHSLILGAYVSGDLHHFGSVSSGLTAKDLYQIRKELDMLITPNPPFAMQRLSKESFWLKPVIVCEVEYLDFTENLALRDPVFKSFCPGAKAEEVQF